MYNIYITSNYLIFTIAESEPSQHSQSVVHEKWAKGKDSSNQTLASWYCTMSKTISLYFLIWTVHDFDSKS